MASTGPQAAMLAAKVQKLLPDMGRWMGIEEQYLPGESEQKQFMELVAQLVAQQQEKAAMPKTPTPQPSAPYVNGAAI